MKNKKSWCKGQTKENNPILARASIKQSLAHIGNKNPMYGKPAWNKGKKWSEEVKQKIKESRKRIKLSRESIQKMIETKRKKGIFKRDSEKMEKNPLMHNPEIVKKQSETMRLKFKRGELKSWNKGLTKETNIKVSQQSKKLKEYFKLNPISEETKKKISNTKKGKTWEEIYGQEKAKEMKKFYSNIMKENLRSGKMDLSKIHKGKKLSEETKKKISLTHKDKRLSEGHKSKIRIGILDNKNIKSRRLLKIKQGIYDNPNEIRFCACGCNQIIKYNYHRKKLARFITGHQSKGSLNPFKGKKHSKETIDRIRETNIKRDNYKKVGLINKEKWKNSEYKEKHSKRLREYRKTQVLPVKDTKIEVKIRNFLDSLKMEYFQHKYMNIEHSYQCDILIPSLNLVIECDGNYWHKYPIGNDIDHVRTKELIEKGFKVLRLWESEIKIMGLEEFKIKIQKIGEKDID